MTRQPNHRWTSEDLARLRILWLTGHTGGEIAKALGVTRNAVLAMVKRIGIPKMTNTPMTWNSHRLKLLKELWSEGLSASQIGKQIGVSRNAVLGKLHRMGISDRKKAKSHVIKPVVPKKVIDRPLMDQKWGRYD